MDLKLIDIVYFQTAALAIVDVFLIGYCVKNFHYLFPGKKNISNPEVPESPTPESAATKVENTSAPVALKAVTPPEVKGVVAPPKKDSEKAPVKSAPVNPRVGIVLALIAVPALSYVIYVVFSTPVAISAPPKFDGGEVTAVNGVPLNDAVKLQETVRQAGPNAEVEIVTKDSSGNEVKKKVVLPMNVAPPSK